MPYEILVSGCRFFGRFGLENGLIRGQSRDQRLGCGVVPCRRPVGPATVALVVTALTVVAFGLGFGAPAKAGETQYAAIVTDADSGRVFYEHNADQATHPASLAKMMTLYLTFEALRAGTLSPTKPLEVSAHAAAQPPSRLGLETGATITVQAAILALVTKSANDAASALAEGLAESEPAFARRMTSKARDLGMKSTRFRNASGLHDPDQVTTARDMMVLARALLRDFPERSRFFAVREFEHGGRVYTNHNGLLATYAGTDGIKTGYIRAAGFHLAASVHREGRHLLGVVMGGRSAAVRDLNMIYLFERAFARLRVEHAGGVLNEFAVAGPSAPHPGSTAPRSALTGEGDGTALEDWGVQVGAYADPASATGAMERAARLLPSLLARATPSVIRITTRGRTLHRARVLGITRDQALQACARLFAVNMACLPVEPGGGVNSFN